MQKGTLYMIPCPIADQSEPFAVLPASNKQVINGLDYFIVEDVRSARRFLSKCKIERKIDELEFVELNEHTHAGAAVEAMIRPLLAGRSAGVISEAGVPGVADPGALVVEACHAHGIKVVPLVGPSSILLAMMASGLNGQSFAFNGYLPIKPNERGKALKALERKVKLENQAQIFIEAPYRNVKLAQDILQMCSPELRLVIACDITSEQELIQMKRIAEWRKQPLPDIAKRPTIFVIG